MFGYAIFMKDRKGIILAGGNGTRLSPLTISVSKQLLPIFDKPMIMYPLSTLMLAGIKDILIITNPLNLDLFKKLFGNGDSLGISLNYAVQENPNGIAESFIIGADFIRDSPVALILGDNLFYGTNLINKLENANKNFYKNTIFAYQVNDPERYGVVTFDNDGLVTNIQEKPENPKSKYAITGLYFYDNSIIDKATRVKPSNRGELEISEINALYLEEKNLNVESLGRGMLWMDMGTFDSLHQASSYVRTLEKRQGLKICCPEEISWRKGWISNDKLKKYAYSLRNEEYRNYFLDLIFN